MKRLILKCLVVASGVSSICSCTSSATVSDATVPTVVVKAAMLSQYVATGAIFQVTATAMVGSAPIVGLTLTFAAEPSTVTLAPATAVTNAAGAAMSYAFVPYDSEGTIIASGGGAVSSQMMTPLVNNPITLTQLSVPTASGGTMFPLSTDGGTGPGGTFYEVSTTARIVADAAVGGLDTMLSTNVPGVPVTFSVLFPVGSGSPVIAPTMATTNSNGVATAAIAVPPSLSSVVVEATTGISTVEAVVPQQ